MARAERMVPRFTLDPTDADEPPADGARREKSKRQKFRQSYVPEWSVWRSWSIALPYVAMLVPGSAY